MVEMHLRLDLDCVPHTSHVLECLIPDLRPMFVPCPQRCSRLIACGAGQPLFLVPAFGLRPPVGLCCLCTTAACTSQRCLVILLRHKGACLHHARSHAYVCLGVKGCNVGAQQCIARTSDARFDWHSRRTACHACANSHQRQH
jgi:hypothetical protein